MALAPHATLIGSIGVSLLLLAYFLNLSRHLPAERPAYLVLNLVGAALAGLSSWLIDFMPFVLLEGTWALVSLVQLARTARPGTR